MGKITGVYNHIIDVAKKQLFAVAPAEGRERLREELYINNVSRFSIQSTVLVLMDTGLLLSLVLNQGGFQGMSPFHWVLVAKVLLMACASLLFARMSGKPYRPSSFCHRHIDLIYPVIHIIGELALFLTGPQDLGAVVRLFAVPFIVGGIPIINQAKSAVLLTVLHIATYTLISHTAYDAFRASYLTFFNYWFVAYACSIFISITVYSWFVNKYIASLASERAAGQLKSLNAHLEQQVSKRTNVLSVVNDIAMELLGSTVETFDRTIFSCMARIGTTANVDRVYIWKNHMVGDELYTTQVHEWSGGAEPQQGNELTVSVPFPGDWYPNLSADKCVNGIVREFPPYERGHLEAQGILSIIVVPVFVYGEFWGFVGFDDCRTEHYFTDAEEAILRTVSLLFATGLIRNEMTARLMSATEEALASSRAKTDFLANISHEIRTPINAITGMSQIARTAESTRETIHCLDRIDAASRQLLSIINDVLDMSKIEAGKIELNDIPFRLSSVLENIRSIVGVQAEEKGLTLACGFDASLPDIVVGDDMRLSQVLINILSNAVKFTPRGGRVDFAARSEGCTPDGAASLVFSVTDTGIGMTTEQQAHLFKKFEQADRGISRRFGGTGLGLAISKNIVDLMGGTITVESADGQGSRFTVALSMKTGAEEMLQQSAPVQSGANDFSGRRALLVEDIEINREIVLSMLEDTGITIDQAEDGQQALELVRDNPGLYDIIFMDLHMPRMDGYTATQKLRELPGCDAASLPIIAMTANAFAEDIQKCLSIGMNDHVAKPVDFGELMSKMRTLMLHG